VSISGSLGEAKTKILAKIISENFRVYKIFSEVGVSLTSGRIALKSWRERIQTALFNTLRKLLPPSKSFQLFTRSSQSRGSAIGQLLSADGFNENAGKGPLVIPYYDNVWKTFFRKSRSGCKFTVNLYKTGSSSSIC